MIPGFFCLNVLQMMQTKKGVKEQPGAPIRMLSGWGAFRADDTHAQQQLHMSNNANSGNVHD